MVVRETARQRSSLGSGDRTARRLFLHDTGTAAALTGQMHSVLGVRNLRRFILTHLAILPCVLLGGCSKTEVNLSAPPSSESGFSAAAAAVTTTSQKTNSAANRLIEIDRLLAM